MAIIDLLDFQDIVIPTQDERVTDIMNLALQENIFQNPLAANLSSASTSASDVSSLVNGPLSQSNISDLIDDLPATDLDFTPALKTELTNALNDMADASLPYEGASSLMTDGLSRLTNHSNVLSSNSGVLTNTVSQVLQTPSSIVSDIAGGFPSDFPGVPGLDSIPPFPGLDSLDAIPSLSVPSLDAIPGLPSISDLPGVNLPGVPSSDDVLSVLGGSILSEEFGGVGIPLSANVSSITSGALTGLAPMGSVVSDISGNLTDTAALAALVPNASSAVTDFAPGLEALAPAFSAAGGAVGDLVNAEESGLFGAGCTDPSALTGAIQCNSASAAKGLASSTIETAKIQSGAKILSSVGTPALKSVLDI